MSSGVVAEWKYESTRITAATDKTAIATFVPHKSFSGPVFDATFTGTGASDISAWDTSSATNMTAMFAGLTAFNGPISGWDTQNCTNLYVRFALSFD